MFAGGTDYFVGFCHKVAYEVISSLSVREIQKKASKYVLFNQSILMPGAVQCVFATIFLTLLDPIGSGTCPFGKNSDI